jgi:hypothetical protein
VIGLSSPVKSIRVGTLGIRVGTLSIRAPVADDAQVFAKRRLVETLKHRETVRGPWAQRRSARANRALWNRRSHRGVFVVFVGLGIRSVAEKLVANTLDVTVAEHL